MKAKVYRQMGEKELEEELKKLKKELMKSHGVVGMAKVKSNPSAKAKKGSSLTRRIKREIARIKTVIREKQLENTLVSKLDKILKSDKTFSTDGFQEDGGE